ncbi:MAG: cupin domain-containing protein [Chloroflexi bacterium]|nr:MAG: cupin domain-containing protein [Chloroflexota bacterium]
MANDQTHLVRPSERKRETTQTPGMEREQAVRTPSMWAGVAKTEGHTFSGWHHHGAYESAIYVLRGRIRLEFGKRGKDVLEAAAGDTLYVAPGEIHREGNPDDEASELVVVRGGSGDIVTNVDGPAAE